MRVTLLSIILMMIGAVMMGCTDDIIPCQSDAECQFDFGWDSDAANHGDFSMYCNMEVSPLQECEEMAAYLEYIPDFIPIQITIDCSEFADMGPDMGWGVCDSDWGWGW